MGSSVPTTIYKFYFIYLYSSFIDVDRYHQNWFGFIDLYSIRRSFLMPTYYYYVFFFY